MLIQKGRKMVAVVKRNTNKTIEIEPKQSTTGTELLFSTARVCTKFSKSGKPAESKGKC